MEMLLYLLFVLVISFLISLKRLWKIGEMKIEAGAIKQREVAL
jgi:hypothetical protein